jgi:hypothetical protein
MFRQILFCATTAICLFSSATLLAGGPPWLCLPVDGVTSENAQACGDLIGKALHDKVWSHPDRQSRIDLQEHKNQWYVTLYMQEDVGLHEVESALDGSEFSVPREKLHLFGHVILEIESPNASSELLADLDAMNYVSIAESNHKDKLFLVTVDMPYPESSGSQQRDSIAWEKFRRTDFSSDQATRSEAPATAGELPSIDAFRKIVMKHDAKLQDVRWSINYACRPVGGVAVEQEPTVASAKP